MQSKEEIRSSAQTESKTNSDAASEARGYDGIWNVDVKVNFYS